MVKKLKNIIPKKLLRQPLTRDEVEKMVYALLPFGYVKGRIGQWRVRWQNGQPIVYKKAEIYNASHTVASINNRNSMGAAFRLAAALNKDLLKEIWTTAQADGRNSYTRLIKHFRKTLKGNVPSIDNGIAPAGHHFEAEDLVTFDSERRIKLKKNLSSDSSLVIVLVPFAPKKSGLKEFEVINIQITPSAGSEIKLSDENLDICKNYNKYILYSVLIRRSNNGVTWSNTKVTKGQFSAVEVIAIVPEGQYLHRLRGLRRKIRGLRTEVRKTKDHAPPGRAAA